MYTRVLRTTVVKLSSRSLPRENSSFEFIVGKKSEELAESPVPCDGASEEEEAVTKQSASSAKSASSTCGRKRMISSRPACIVRWPFMRTERASELSADCSFPLPSCFITCCHVSSECSSAAMSKEETLYLASQVTKSQKNNL